MHLPLKVLLWTLSIAVWTPVLEEHHDTRQRAALGSLLYGWWYLYRGTVQYLLILWFVWSFWIHLLDIFRDQDWTQDPSSTTYRSSVVIPLWVTWTGRGGWKANRIVVSKKSAWNCSDSNLVRLTLASYGIYCASAAVLVHAKYPLLPRTCTDLDIWFRPKEGWLARREQLAHPFNCSKLTGSLER